MECRTEAVGALIEQLSGTLAAQVAEWVEAVEELEEGPRLLEAVEQRVQAGVAQLGQQALEGVVQLVGTGKTEQTPLCESCGEPLRYVRDQARRVKTLLGVIRLRRAYYHCRTCQAGYAPLEQQLGVAGSGLSRGLQALLCRLGAHLPFESARRLLSELLPLTVDDNTVQRVVQQVGAAVQQQQAQRVQQVWETAAPPATVGTAPQRLYLSVDGTTVHLEEGWKEVKVAAL